MDKKYYLKDVRCFENISHFKDLRNYIKKDDDGFYFKDVEVFALVALSACVLEEFYKPLTLTFDNCIEVYKQFKKDYFDIIKKDATIYKSVRENISSNTELEKYGFNKNKIMNLTVALEYINFMEEYIIKIKELQKQSQQTK